MYYDEYMMLSKDDIEKIKNKLNIVKLLVEDSYAKEKVQEVLDIIIKEDAEDEPVSIQDIIYEKMKETKSTNPDLNAELYMLYRKLQDNKIGPEEALSLYKAYTSE